jgi:hypothetical protein
MQFRTFILLGLAASTALAVPSAASAEGKTAQARKAIAAAQAKIDAANIVGAAGDAPRLHAEAVATLHLAQDELAHHAKDAAIRDATRASEIADQALAASERERKDEQQAATSEAQHQAAEANARAANAQAAAASAQADAAAARAAPPVVIQTPAPAVAAAPTETSVTTTTTDQAAPAAVPKRAKHRVVHSRSTRRPAAHTSTTTVTTKTH